MDNNEAKVIGIARHRLTTDGGGVTTLVAFHGCPLHCRFCLNPQCMAPPSTCRSVTATALVEELMTDHLYFVATGGGVAWGGGEPLLHHAFMKRVMELAPREWNFYMETSLQVNPALLQDALPRIRHFYVDIKDTDPTVYHAYTGGSATRALNHLAWLLTQVRSEDITVRLPLIPGFNTNEHRRRSRALLKEMGVVHIDEFTYLLPDKG